MPDNIFLYFIIVSILLAVGKSIYFLNEKKKILTNYKLPNSIELKNISGTIFTDKGFLSWGLEFGTFDLLINDNSIFLFMKSLGFIPSRITNLIFSNSNRKNIQKATLLRDYKIDHNNIQFIYYPEHLIGRSRKIILENLTQDQISLLENLLDGKSRRFY
jgi:hypothetical protein